MESADNLYSLVISQLSKIKHIKANTIWLANLCLQVLQHIKRLILYLSSIDIPSLWTNSTHILTLSLFVMNTWHILSLCHKFSSEQGNRGSTPPPHQTFCQMLKGVTIPYLVDRDGRLTHESKFVFYYFYQSQICSF